MSPRPFIILLFSCLFATALTLSAEAAERGDGSIDALVAALTEDPEGAAALDEITEAVRAEPERAGEFAAALVEARPDLAGDIVRSVVNADAEAIPVGDVVQAAIIAAPEAIEAIVEGAHEAAPERGEEIDLAAVEAMRSLARTETGGDSPEIVEEASGEPGLAPTGFITPPDVLFPPLVVESVRPWIERPAYELATEEILEEMIEDVDEEIDTISVDFPDTDIRNVLRQVADLYDLNLVIPEELTGRTSVQLRDVTWEQVFDIVLSPRGYTYRDDAGIIRIVPDDFVDEEDRRVVLHEDGRLTVSFEEDPIAEIVALVASRADLNVVIPQDFMAMGAEANATIRLREVTWQQVFDVTLSQIGYGYIDRDDIIRVETLDRIESVPPATRVLQVKYPSAEIIAEFVRNLSGVQQVQVDTGTNVLIVTAEEGRMREIQNLVDRLDQPAQQVLIEAMFVEVSSTDARELGVKWDSLANGMELSAGPGIHRFERLRGQADPGFSDLMDSVGTARHTEAIFSASEFNAILTALQRDTDARLTANPTVVTLNAKDAEIQVIDHLYRDGAINVFGTGQPGDPVRESFEEPILLDPLPGIILTVTPTISGGDLINLNARPEINNVVGQQILGQGQVIPTIRQRFVESNVMVKSGQTLAMSGLADEDSITVESRVPVLGDIPLLGRLFRSDSQDQLKKDQIIFITATITDPNRHNYTDFADERRMVDLGLSHRDVQGSQYQRTEEEEEYLRELSRRRAEAEQEQVRLWQDSLDSRAEEGADDGPARARTGPRQRR